MDTTRITTDQLEVELRRLEALKRQITATQISLVAEADRRQVATWDGCRSLTEWVSAQLDLPSSDAGALVTLSRRLGDLPLLARALARGDVGVSRAEAISKLANTSTEGDLISRTSGFDLAGLRRWVARHRRLSRGEERAGESQSFLLLQPSLDESWWRISGGVAGVAGAVIERAVRQRGDHLGIDRPLPRAYRQALALESLCADSLDGSQVEGAGGGGPSVTAFVDLDLAAVTGGEAGAELCAGPRIGPDALQELWCEGAVRLVGLADQKPVVTSDSARSIPPAVRDFVLWRDGGCRAPGCGSRYRLQPHHLHLRSHGGGHDPSNLVTLCWFHHHVVVHRRGFRLEAGDAGSVRFVPPQDARDPP